MKRFFLCGILLGALTASAQQDPLSAQYINAPILINPAYSGMSKDLNMVADYRKQWAGFAGSPQTTTVVGHMAMRKNIIGMGAKVVQDKVGVNSSTDVQASYAYHLPVTSETTLSFGMQLGMINYRTDYSELVINPNDPGFTSTSEWQPNFGAGLILTNEKYFLSVSSMKMLEPKAQLAKQGLYRRDVNVMAAYTFQLTSRLRLKPFAMYRGAAESAGLYDIGMCLLGDDSYTIGAFTRRLNEYGLIAQLKLGEMIRVGYAFELPTNKSTGTGFTSHELQIIFRTGVLTSHEIGAVRNF